MKQSIPQNWIDIVKQENSVQSTVNVQRNKITWKGGYFETICFSNKMLYDSLVNNKKEPSVGINRWLKILPMQEAPNMNSLYNFIFKYLTENKLKIYRWKLLQFIVPTKKILLQWKITNNNMCNFCNIEEDYSHYFFSCSYLTRFWQQIYDLLKRSNLDFLIKLQNLIFGYKITDNKYYSINYLITIISFSIYKSYYVSEQKTKNIDVYRIFVNEYTKRVDTNINGHKTISPMLLTIKRNIINE